MRRRHSRSNRGVHTTLHALAGFPLGAPPAAHQLRECSCSGKVQNPTTARAAEQETAQLHAERYLLEAARDTAACNHVQSPHMVVVSWSL
jgi:hypothetical protein